MQPVPVCNMTRAELQRLLQESGFGANESMFSCYFAHNTTGGQPLCANCRQQIAAHGDGSAGVYGVPLSDYPQKQVPNYPSYGGSAPLAVQMVQVVNEPPPNLVMGSNGVDTVDTPFNRPLIAVSFFLVCIGVVLLAVFASVGILSKAPVCIVGPCIQFFIAFVFLAINNKVHVEFNKNTRVVTSTTTNLLLRCLATPKSSTFDNLGLASLRTTNVRVNRENIAEIVIQVRNSNESIVVARAGIFSLLNTESRWNYYLSTLRPVPLGTSLVPMPLY